MFCPQCRTSNNDDARFCIKCGYGLLENKSNNASDQNVKSQNQTPSPSAGGAEPEGTLIVPAGRYKDMTPIGKGGMGVVYKAYDSVMEEWVALKTLPAEFSENQTLLKRFLKEARETRKLSHPNIIRVHDVIEIDQALYISMEYIDGKDLKAIIQERSPLDLNLVEDLFVQICSGLAYAHKQGLVHRDIKPQNILIDKSGRPEITDFGIAKAQESTGLTMSGQTLGTPAYMSPEQAQGQPVDQRSDIYSLGIVLYEMITGQTPFQAETPISLVMKHINEPPPKPSLLRKDLAPPWENIIAKCLAKKPEERYAIVNDIIEEIKNKKDDKKKRWLNNKLFEVRPGPRQRLKLFFDSAGLLAIIALLLVSYFLNQTTDPSHYYSYIERLNARLFGDYPQDKKPAKTRKGSSLDKYREQGFTDKEIEEFGQRKKIWYKWAISDGYSRKEIDDHWKKNYSAPESVLDDSPDKRLRRAGWSDDQILEYVNRNKAWRQNARSEGATEKEIRGYWNKHYSDPASVLNKPPANPPKSKKPEN